MISLGTCLANCGTKNSRFFYYVRNLFDFALPPAFCRRKLAGILRKLSPEEADAIAARVNYYCRIAAPFDPAEIDSPFRFAWTKGPRNYNMDLHEYARYFDPRLRIRYRFSDTTSVPDRPTVVKARPIDGHNGNSVLFKLNKVRHFVFVADHMRFEDKIDRLVWRGNAHQENRKRFLERYFNHPRCDVGHYHRRERNQPWSKGFLSIRRQLRYKYVLSLEGNDVASNLKWIMSSNSLCFMARPRFETWFMEGTLIPGTHFVPLADDFSDLEEKLLFYPNHAAAALDIIRNANAYAATFKDEARETLVALLVLKKYFEMSGQWPQPLSQPTPTPAAK